MTDMKCPFCQQELEINDLDVQLLGCENQNCKHSIHYDTVGSKELWQELIRTRKTLDVAVDALKSAHEYYQNCVIREKQPHEINWYCTAMNMDNDISEALEQITALEQKDNGDNK